MNEMRIGSFLQFVEIQTKLASIIPFIMGTLFSLYRYESFNSLNFIIMLVSLLTFDMATTAINNYLDYKKSLVNEGYNYRQKNAIVRDGISETMAVVVIFVLLSIAIVFGVVLTLRTDIIVLLIGMLSFMVGILYTFGPVPISRMPLGEMFSGVFMGFVIMFIAVYIHIFDRDIILLIFDNNMLNISFNIIEVIYIFLFSIPAVCGIANIMLANNICDIEEDMVNKRFTLPYYLGRPKALKLFEIIYYIGYLDIILITVLGIAPMIILLALFTIIPVSQNIRKFCIKPLKGKTFVFSVKNFALMMTAEIIFMGMAVIGSKLG